ncbi:MAG: DNA starvation/stationary phase protection protein [Micavibrio sp.]|nr:DNA starvation/stationary phase protection protein [Micavibrio sp.]
MAEKNSNRSVVDALSKTLADTYTLYLKTQNYHWNVTGPGFHGLHIMFEEQYKDLAAASDEIAERIRALGEKAPASFTAFAKLAKIKEENGNPDYKKMLANLVKDNETAVDTFEALIKTAQDEEDEGSADLAIRRLQVHQKNHWMLKAYLD